MEDVQEWPDSRGIDLDSVGVSDLRYPIVVLDRGQSKQTTVAQFNISVRLARHVKGTHMSRFVEVLHESRGNISARTMPRVLRILCERLGTETARLEVRFPYFLDRSAPASGATGLMDYECSFVGEVSPSGDDFVLGVRVPVTSLCPCSKEISDYGAHNQRGYIEIQIRSDIMGGPRSFVWIEELIEIAEFSASAPVYPVLKRPDERHVTMQAYENPMFVEDMVRSVARALQDDVRISWFNVRAENQESIHNHNAFAETSWARSV